jgi:hypothetical protein
MVKWAAVRAAGRSVGKKLRIGFDYAGVSRLSDRHQIEAWITALVRFCREATARELRPISVRVRHQRIRESDEFDQFFGLTARARPTRGVRWNVVTFGCGFFSVKIWMLLT